jgi:hypothetical protein
LRAATDGQWATDVDLRRSRRDPGASGDDHCAPRIDCCVARTGWIAPPSGQRAARSAHCVADRRHPVRWLRRGGTCGERGRRRRRRGPGP